MDFAAGAMIGGKYRLERKIAEGGMGEVWISQTSSGERVAIKRLHADASRDREVVTRFRREALLLGKIQSEHVSRVIEQVKDPSFGELLVMEYVEGESLADLLDKRRVLTVEETLELGLDLTRAVADLHRVSIVHRDLKPENVILKRAPNGERKAVLIDFGLARLLKDGEEKPAGEETLTGITRAETAVGTIYYMAPEQILSSRDVSRAADVYAVGAILYRAASGRNVFGDELDDLSYARQKLNEEAPPIDLPRKDDVAAALARIITRAVKRRPAERYEGIDPMQKEIAEAHQQAQAGPNSDADAPTKHAPISSLLGSAFAETVRPPKDDGPALAETILPGLNQAPAPASVRLAPAPMPNMMRPPATHTVPMPPSTPMPAQAPTPAPTMHMPPQMAPPPVPLAYSRPVAATGAEPVGAAALRAATLPIAKAPDLASDDVPRKVAILGAAVALVVGIAVGFVLHTAISASAPECPPATGEAPPGKR